MQYDDRRYHRVTEEELKREEDAFNEKQKKKSKGCLGFILFLFVCYVISTVVGYVTGYIEDIGDYIGSTIGFTIVAAIVVFFIYSIDAQT